MMTTVLAVRAWNVCNSASCVNNQLEVSSWSAQTKGRIEIPENVENISTGNVQKLGSAVYSSI